MTQRIEIRVIPRSSRNEIIGPLQQNESYKVKLTTAPVDGEANKKLIAFLSNEWGITKSKLRIIKGEKGRTKLIEIDD